MNSGTRLVAALVGAAISSLAIAAKRQPVSFLELSLRVRYEPSCNCLHVDLKNEGNTLIKTCKDNLPWVNVNSILLIAVNSRTREVISHVGIVDDPGPETVIIHGNESLGGNIDLGARLPVLKRVLAGGDDVILFWSYQLHALSGDVSDHVNGAIVLTNTGN